MLRLCHPNYFDGLADSAVCFSFGLLPKFIPKRCLMYQKFATFRIVDNIATRLRIARIHNALAILLLDQAAKRLLDMVIFNCKKLLYADCLQYCEQIFSFFSRRFEVVY